MSIFLTNADLLPIAAQLAEKFITAPDFPYVPDTDRTIPYLALEGTEREYVAASGLIAGNNGNLFMRVDTDGGVSMSLTLLVGLGGYSTTLLPEHVGTEAILAHAARAVSKLSRQAAAIKAERKAHREEFEGAQVNA